VPFQAGPESHPLSASDESTNVPAICIGMPAPFRRPLEELESLIPCPYVKRFSMRDIDGALKEGQARRRFRGVSCHG
jgi:hypothetical protein